MCVLRESVLAMLRHSGVVLRLHVITIKCPSYVTPTSYLDYVSFVDVCVCFYGYVSKATLTP